MKKILILIISLNSVLQSNAQNFKQHKISLGFTALQGLTDGFRDASLFGRIKNAGQWYNGMESWKLKYKNQDPQQGAAFFGSTTVFVMFTDAPHLSNSISHMSGEMAKVYMPDMTNKNFWQKFKTVLVYCTVRSAAHNFVYGFVFKKR